MTDPSQYFKGRTVQEQMNEVIGYVDVRSAEVATDAIASDVAQVHQDMLDADADATAAAASAAAAAGTLANAVKKTGEASQSIDGDIDLNDDLNVDGDATVGGTLSVTGAVTVPTPLNNTDAANKKYVDDADALMVPITDINSYAVGLTDNQPSVAGVKGFYQLPSVGYRIRVTGTDKRELFRTPVTNGNTVISVIASTRSSTAITLGMITVVITSGVITGVTKDVISNKTTNATNLYAHIEDGNLIISVGNEITFNNYISTTVLGLFTGAGDVKNPDYSNIGRDTTSLVNSNMSVILCQ